MIEERIIKLLDNAWEMEEGFFYEIRNRNFDLKKGNGLHSLLQKIDLEKAKTIDKKLVRLLWYIPIYLDYQKDTLKPVLSDEKYTEYVRCANRIQGEVERILGCP